jgi:hypothetical protein
LAIFLGQRGGCGTDDDAALIDWDVTWTSDPLVLSVKSTRLVINGLVHELRLSVVLAGSDSDPLYLKFEDREADIANQPIPWRCAGQFDDLHRTILAKYLCILSRSRRSKIEIEQRLRKTFLILEPAAKTSGTYQQADIADIMGTNRTFGFSIRRTLNLVWYFYEKSIICASIVAELRVMEVLAVSVQHFNGVYNWYAESSDA